MFTTIYNPLSSGTTTLIILPVSPRQVTGTSRRYLIISSSATLSNYFVAYNQHHKFSRFLLYYFGYVILWKLFILSSISLCPKYFLSFLKFWSGRKKNGSLMKTYLDLNNTFYFSNAICHGQIALLKSKELRVKPNIKETEDM